MPSARHARWSIAGALVLCSVRIASAQTGQTGQLPLQFDFLNPGARSLAVGSAFLAVAEDATTAFTNPSGLRTLPLQPQLSVEFRYRDLDTPYLSGGRLSGSPSGQPPDISASPTYGISADSAFRPYFIAFVYPFTRWTVAGFRHELVLQTNAFLSQGPYYSLGGVFNDSRLPGLTGERDIRIVTYGASAAFEVIKDRLSIGESISFYRFSLNAHFAALGHVGSQDGPADLDSAGKTSSTQQGGAGTQVGVNVGALITVRKDGKVRIGAVYRQSVSFLFTETNNVINEPTLTRVGTFRTPGIIGAGVRLKPWEAAREATGEATRKPGWKDTWTFSVDYDYVQYSHLTTHFVTFQVDPAVVDRVSIHDGHEVHFGAQYTFPHFLKQLSLRGGSWFDPDHSIQYVSDGSGSDSDTRLKAVFPGGGSVWHYCWGAGLTLSDRWEIHGGADFSSRRKYLSVSAVAYLGTPKPTVRDAATIKD
jgi:long-chain fatty acid transport protein